MPRRNTDRRRRPGDRPAPGQGTDASRVENGPDGQDWQVRTISGAQATKTYRCPGCDHPITPGVAHLVAWPSAEFGGADERRHWHRGCWAGRGRRGLTRRWS